MNKSYKNLVFSAVCLALCMLLPLLTGQLQQLGNALCPMHIPVLICGFIAGPWYAAAVGAIAPLLRFLIFGMPPIFPIGIAMCFELAAYGAVSGFLYKLLPKKTLNIYASLIAAMLAGRVVWGIVRAVLSGASGSPFTWQAFLAGGFINAVPGIILHILLIPVIVMALERAGFMKERTVT